MAAWGRLRQVDTSAGRRVAQIDLIRSTRLLRGLRVAELEAVAAAAKPKRIAVGEDVIREGDRDAQAFYVLEEGTAEVLVQEKLLRTLGPGESFGEIALLHGIQRTATVRARAALDLLEVNRSDFIWAVTGAEHSSLLRQRPEHAGDLALRTVEEALTNIPWVAHLDPAALTELAGAARRGSISAGEILWSQGEAGDTLVIILAGTLSVEQGGRREGTVGPGECLGEIAVLHGVPRTATIRAKAATTFYELTRDQVRAALAVTEGDIRPLVDRLS